MLNRRKFVPQPDVLEWAAQQSSVLKVLRREQIKRIKGFVAYGKMALEFFQTKDDGKAEDSTEKKSPDLASMRLAQYYESQDLLKQMKWKRITWEENADYAGFAKRIMDNDKMFKHVPAFSFMSIHVVKDKLTSDFVSFPPAQKTIEAGGLTNWVLQERDPVAVPPFALSPSTERRSGFSVDLTCGEVNILDSASAEEVLTFLTTVAPRLQSVQQKLEAQQTRITENLEYVRVRAGVVVKFNEFDTSYWDDPKRLTTENYITPDEVDTFLNGMLASSFLYRQFFKHQHIRIMPPGTPYNADLDTKELQFPANFAEYNWLAAHERFEGVEKVLNSFRRFWWFWCCVAMVLFGDVDVL